MYEPITHIDINICLSPTHELLHRRKSYLCKRDEKKLTDGHESDGKSVTHLRADGQTDPDKKESQSV